MPEHVRVVRNQDGIYLHFGDAMISLDSVIEGRPPLVQREIRAFCLRVAEDA